MGQNTPLIFLGDLARAMRALHVSDHATLETIAELLGMRLGRGATGPGAGSVLLQSGPDEDVLAGSEEAIPNEAEDALPEDWDERESIPIDVESSPSVKEEWLPEVEPLPPPAADVVPAPPPLEPLLVPHWARGIISAALATDDEDGPLDVERVAEMLAKQECVRQLPTLPSRTLRRGLQLLVDKSQAMMPFARDQSWMLDEIRDTVGVDGVEVLRFVGCPLRGAGKGRKPWPVYRLPLPGTPVVLLTDLGICQPMLTDDWADTPEWLNFATAVRRAGCPLLALVPYGPSRWHPALARLMTIIQWDRNTTAATVNKLVRHAFGAVL
ncbi:MAG: hypothetical protein ACJ74T_08610 [Pyrinomonadaceae bacterium]